MGRLADTIRGDFMRWPEFQKSARTANYSKRGVIFEAEATRSAPSRSAASLA